MGCQFSARRRLYQAYQISPESPPDINTSFASPPSPGSHGTLTSRDCDSKSSLMAINCRQTPIEPTKSIQDQVNRIDILPDDVLLEIFNTYMHPRYYGGGLKTETERWQSLVHVCRRWRSLVLGSPRYLNLRLICTPSTPVRETLDVWPALPLIVQGSMASTSGMDNVIAAFGQSNRVREVYLWHLAGRQLEQILAAMQVPFPELTDLRLYSDGKTLPVIPDSFLAGSAPRLQRFVLDGIPFPGLPNSLCSATRFVTLRLEHIPHSGYIPPDAMVTLISVLSRLETLFIGFQSPQSHPRREIQHPHPSKRSVIPSLISLFFEGVIEYLEDLVAFIDTPQLDEMDVTFFNQISFDIPRLAQFINRTPKLTKPYALVLFDDKSACVKLQPGRRTLQISTSCREPDWQLSFIEQVCNSLKILSNVQELSINHLCLQRVWMNETIENTLWLHLLRPFTAVKSLYLSKEFSPGIAAALKEFVGGRRIGVLPNLQNIFVEELERSGPFKEDIGQFVDARRPSHHAITIFDWDGESY